MKVIASLLNTYEKALPKKILQQSLSTAELFFRKTAVQKAKMNREGGREDIADK